MPNNLLETSLKTGHCEEFVERSFVFELKKLFTHSNVVHYISQRHGPS